MKNINKRTVMRITKMLLLANVISLSTALAQENSVTDPDFPPLENRYLDQKPPGLIPEVFAPGIVSINGRNESGISFSPDLDEVYFTVNKKDEETSIYFSKL